MQAICEKIADGLECPDDWRLFRPMHDQENGEEDGHYAYEVK